MKSQGFIFSLDAFVAFMLIMLTISLLLFTIGTPSAFYPQLEQAHQLAHDTLYVLATTSDNPGYGSYLEQILAMPNKQGTMDTGAIMRSVAGGEESKGFNGIIPPGFGYRLETYDFTTGDWTVKYDSSTDAASDRKGKVFSKLAASAMTFDSLYTVPANPGRSPFCGLSCKGYDVDMHPPGDLSYCSVTPCDISKSNFNAGEESIQLVRLTVYA